MNERHPERNTDVVLFVDSFTDVRGAGRSLLEDAIRVPILPSPINPRS